MKILLIGKSGQVGSEIFELFTKNNIEVVSFSSKELDITDINSLDKKREYFNNLDFVINSAAYTLVDKAEDEHEIAYKINQIGSRNIANICKKFNIPLVHISTDYVFSGDNEINFENDAVFPQSVYGNSKALGENEILSLINNFIILRVSWVFGINGNNFVKTILRLAQERKELKVVHDQTGCPTPADDTARVLLQIIKQKDKEYNFGIYHYTGLEKVTWYEFALKIIEIARKYTTLTVENVVPITSAEYPSKAKRPKSSILACDNILKDYGVEQESWVPYLENTIKSILKINSKT